MTNLSPQHAPPRHPQPERASDWREAGRPQQPQEAGPGHLQREEQQGEPDNDDSDDNDDNDHFDNDDDDAKVAMAADVICDNLEMAYDWTRGNIR